MYIRLVIETYPLKAKWQVVFIRSQGGIHDFILHFIYCMYTVHVSISQLCVYRLFDVMFTQFDVGLYMCYIYR